MWHILSCPACVKLSPPLLRSDMYLFGEFSPPVFQELTQLQGTVVTGWAFPPGRANGFIPNNHRWIGWPPLQTKFPNIFLELNLLYFLQMSLNNDPLHYHIYAQINCNEVGTYLYHTIRVTRISWQRLICIISEIEIIISEICNTRNCYRKHARCYLPCNYLFRVKLVSVFVSASFIFPIKCVKNT